MAKPKSKGLGRGLNAIMPDFNEIINETTHSGTNDLKILEVSVDAIQPNPNQPRKQFNDDELQDLKESIREHGILQPLLVTPQGKDKYFLVAGERRLRAAKLADLTTVPVIVKEMNEVGIYEVALIENIQRSNLSAVEEALAYAYLQEHFDYTQEKIAERVGKSRVAIANTIRLLKLPHEVLDLVNEGKLTAGQVRPLLRLEDPGMQINLAHEIIVSELSARDVENLVEVVMALPNTNEKGNNNDDIVEYSTLGVDLKNLQEQLTQHFATKVRIKKGAKKSKLEIDFYGDEDLKRIVDLLGGDFY